MLIVLEGCDGSGKTTFANKLAQIINAEVIHCTAETPNNVEFFRGIIGMSVLKNIIADRFCYGQFVYQKIEERKLSQEQLKQLEFDMMMAGAKVIFVDADTDIIKDRLAARDEETAIPVSQIQYAYDQIFSNSILPVTVVDTTEQQTIIRPFYTKE